MEVSLYMHRKGKAYFKSPCVRYVHAHNTREIKAAFSKIKDEILIYSLIDVKFILS